MAAAEYLVVGHFKYTDDVEKGIHSLREKGLAEEDIQLFSPVPNHDLEDALYQSRPRSPVRRFTLLGGLTGCSGAFLMTCWMSLDWPLRTSAKTILSIPAFVIIAFECTILLGAIFTLIGMLHNSRIPQLFKPAGFSPTFTDDVFGLMARVPKEQTDGIKDLLAKCGAEEVEVQYAR